MANQGQEESPFNQRSDNAAEALKQAMGLEGRKVVVDANGQPPPPPPPEGSYAAMAAEQRDEAVAAQARLNQQSEEAQQRPVEPIEPSPREQLTNDVSDKAAERIKDLVGRLRTQGQELQALQSQNEQTSGQIEEMKALVQQLQAEREELRKASMEHLDPEERQQILSQLEVKQAMESAQKQILDELKPRLERIDAHELAREYDALANAYPEVFDARVHPELIAHFRAANPACSVALAFQAVLSPQELQRLGGSNAATPVPPSIAPTHSGIPKNVPTQAVSQPQTTPEEEIAQEAAEAYKLLRDPAANSQRQGMRAVDAMLAKRLGF